MCRERRGTIIDNLEPFSTIASTVGTEEDKKEIVEQSEELKPVGKKVKLEQPKQPIIKHWNTIISIVISPCGNYVYTGSKDNSICKVNIRRNKKAEFIAKYTGHQGAVTSLAISQCGQYLYSGSMDGHVRRWSTQSGECIKEYKCSDDITTEIIVKLCPIRDHMYVGSNAKLCKIDIESGNTIKTYSLGQAKYQYIMVLQVSSNGERLYAGVSVSRFMLEWDVDHSNPIKSYNGHDNIVTGIALSPNGEHIYTSSVDEHIIKWSILTGEILCNVKAHFNTITDIAITCDGLKLWSTSLDYWAKEWSIADDMVCLRSYNPNNSQLKAVALSPKYEYICTSSKNNDNTLNIFYYNS